MQKIVYLILFLNAFPLAAFSPREFCHDKARVVHDWWKDYKTEQIGGNQRYTLQDDITTIVITGNTGSISVMGTPHRHVVIDATKYGPVDQLHATKAHYQVHGKEARIMTQQNNESDVSVDYIIQVPENISLKIILSEGDIHTKNIKGEQKLITHQGNYTVSQAYNSVEAKAPQGHGTLKQVALPLDASIFLEAFNGIDIKLSSKINASLYARTLQGKIETSSSFYLTLDPLTTQLNKDLWERIKKDIKATIGAGGPPITIEVTKGNILISEL